jgi:hypothetical protein
MNSLVLFFGRIKFKKNTLYFSFFQTNVFSGNLKAFYKIKSSVDSEKRERLQEGEIASESERKRE